MGGVEHLEEQYPSSYMSINFLVCQMNGVSASSSQKIGKANNNQGEYGSVKF